MQSTITESGALFHAQRRARIVKVQRVIRRAELGAERELRSELRRQGRRNQWQRIRRHVAALFGR